MARRGFTLLELLVVMAIMGMMATASVASYRVMRQGMEESAVVRNSSQFIRLAYQRSQIDQVPVDIYFWNETTKEESDTTQLAVCGRAVAVRKMGRVTAKSGQLLLDEFGDLDVFGCRDDEGALDPSSSAYQNDSGTWLYRVNGDETSFERTLVSRFTVPKEVQMSMISYPDTSVKTITPYGYYILPGDGGGVDWKKGDAYGVEFGDFSLPNRYIFGNTYSTSTATPIQEVKVMNFNPLGSNTGSGQTIEIGAIRPNSQGVPEAKKLDKTVAPGRDQQEQNE